MKKLVNVVDYDLDFMVAHAMTFFLDGFETSSIAMSYALYALAANPDVQRKLKAEIDQTLSKSNGEITYECLQEMSYLENVLLGRYLNYKYPVYFCIFLFLDAILDYAV